MAKRKETVTVRAWAVVKKNTDRFCFAESTRFDADLLRDAPHTKIVPCTITYTKPGGKKK